MSTNNRYHRHRHVTYGSQYTDTRLSVVHREGRRVTLAVFITDLLDNLWTPVHISVAPALPYKLLRRPMSPQLAGPTLREVNTWFRQTKCVCVCDVM